MMVWARHVLREPIGSIAMLARRWQRESISRFRSMVKVVIDEMTAVIVRLDIVVSKMMMGCS
jgi:hypothetical protein